MRDRFIHKAAITTAGSGGDFTAFEQDNLALLAHLKQFVDLGYPVLLGTSRKRFMGNICNVSEPSDLVTATAVTTKADASTARIFGMRRQVLHSSRHSPIQAVMPASTGMRRVAVTGTRGKSGVTRLIASGLRASGAKVVAKTTGSRPVSRS